MFHRQGLQHLGSGRLVFDGERWWASMKNRYPSDWYKLLHVNGEVCSQPYLDRNSQTDVISQQLKISGICFSKNWTKAPRKKGTSPKKFKAPRLSIRFLGPYL
jgi:hypothetical protein